MRNEASVLMVLVFAFSATVLTGAWAINRWLKNLSVPFSSRNWGPLTACVLPLMALGAGKLTVGQQILVVLATLRALWCLRCPWLVVDEEGVTVRDVRFLGPSCGACRHVEWSQITGYSLSPKVKLVLFSAADSSLAIRRDVLLGFGIVSAVQRVLESRGIEQVEQRSAG